MQFKSHYTLTMMALVGGLVAAPAMADHNSVLGAGTANMPNDIHNTQIEDDLTQTEFRDFVRKGAGAQTDNRYLDTSTLPSQRSMTGRADRTSMGGGRR